MIMTTISGHDIDLSEPDPKLIDLDDILYALSHVNRFNGHTIMPYSVAQHTLAMVMYLEDGEASLAERQTALIHDFPEYILGDVTSPLKELLGPEYDVLTRRLENAICQRFDILAGGHRFRDIYDDYVQAVDKLAALSEMNLLETGHRHQDTSVVMDQKVSAVMYLGPTGTRNILRRKAIGYLNV